MSRDEICTCFYESIEAEFELLTRSYAELPPRYHIAFVRKSNVTDTKTDVQRQILVK